MNARAIAMQGIGFGAKLVALQGLQPATVGGQSAEQYIIRARRRRAR